MNLKKLQQRYTLDPLSLYRYIRHCLTIEQSLVDSTTTPSTAAAGGVTSSSSLAYPHESLPDPNTTPEIMEKLSLIKHKTMETGDILRRMEQEQEAFALKCHDRQKLEGIIHLHRMQQGQPPTQQSLTIEKNFIEQKQRLEFELKQRVSFFGVILAMPKILSNKLIDIIFSHLLPDHDPALLQIRIGRENFHHGFHAVRFAVQNIRRGTHPMETGTAIGRKWCSFDQQFGYSTIMVRGFGGTNLAQSSPIKRSGTT